jgi:hypothetical protein
MKLKLLAAAAMVMAATTANAASWTFTLITGFGSAAGTFTTVGDGSTPTPITSFTFDNSTVQPTILPTGTYPGVDSNDNLFSVVFPNFTFNGFSFSFDGDSYNLFGENGQQFACNLDCQDPNVFNASFTFASVSGAVPEPESWAMLITGFGIVGTAMRRRRITVAA